MKNYPNSQTPSSITSIILAMTLNPSIQTRAQAELDAVIGSTDDTNMRLPTFTDRERLPYVNAIVKEVLRWNPSVPLGEFNV
jgi:cytochrome P450